ncbi:alpha/beta-hydrolase [Penicillium argentinense]|uniref:Alpha/beta-hydrolase n=1 Tax=Penicillium argentinense TaxID=1131581 RepID=A0A9W9KBW5_9EURO|nr:alpha/beta-hydrolase [Penicillium argentinense]KAJ5100081.1 alpha/beta-hydrolase [Penicillium argentinense]
MSAQKPTAVLIIHGGYFLPAAWNAFSDRLRQAGLVVQCPRLPSCGDERPPTAAIKHDVAAVRKAAQDLITLNHCFLVLAHSYGGMVASEAIRPDLYASNGKGVVGLVLLSSWLVQPGDTLMSVIDKYGFQCKVDLGNNGDGTVFAKNAPESFYNDIELTEAEELAKGNVTHNWLAASAEISGAPWKDLHTTYIHCAQDLAIMLPLQQSMVQDAVNAGGRLTIKTIDSGHCPFLSQPETVIGIVNEVMENVS